MDWPSWNHAAHAMALAMADASVRSLALTVLAVVLACIVRRNAAAQHTVWTLVLAGMLALPFLRPIVPAAYVPLPHALAVRVAEPAPVHVMTIRDRDPLPAPTPPVRLWMWLMAVYSTGVAFFASRLIGGLFLMRRALRSTRTIHPAARDYFDRITYADPEVILAECDFAAVPLTAGLLRTQVILPAEWRQWPQAKLDAILAHELAHARRGDPWIAFLASVNTCIFWFHPLAWWLRRRLAVLAEHAADDAALAVSADTKSYALLLLETAAQLPKSGSRLAWHFRAWNSVAMTGPVVAQRIRRVLSLDNLDRLKPLGAASRALLMAASAALILLTTAVDVNTLSAGQTHVRFVPFTAENAAAWERQLAAHPDDQAARAQLIMYYLFHQQQDRVFAQVIWLIDHHPDSDLLRLGMPLSAREQLDELRSHWAAQLALHPDDARVLINAGAQSAGPQVHMDLLERARHLDPSLATEPLARLDSHILLSSAFGAGDAGLASQVRFNVQSSNDIALVGAVAQYFVEGAASNALTGYAGSFGDARALATELVTHAEALDPRSGWSDLMEGVRALPER